MFDHPIFPALKRWAIFSNKRRQIRPYNSESFQTEPLPNPEGETGQRLLTSTLIRRSCCVIGSSGAKRRKSCPELTPRPLIQKSALFVETDSFRHLRRRGVEPAMALA